MPAPSGQLKGPSDTSQPKIEGTHQTKMDTEEVEEELGFYLLDNKVMQLFGK